MTIETDRELLELAAKAAGYTIKFIDTAVGPRPDVYDKDGNFLEDWNPLTDDGDALRLAAELGLWITRNGIEIEVRHLAAHYLDGPTYVVERTDSPNCYAATRRAIVRAAAEIGRAMK